MPNRNSVGECPARTGRGVRLGQCARSAVDWCAPQALAPIAIAVQSTKATLKFPTLSILFIVPRLLGASPFLSGKSLIRRVLIRRGRASASRTHGETELSEELRRKVDPLRDVAPDILRSWRVGSERRMSKARAARRQRLRSQRSRMVLPSRPAKTTPRVFAASEAFAPRTCRADALRWRAMGGR